MIDRRRAVRLGWAGFAWALLYIPIHLYFAVGGTWSWIGLTSDDSGSTWRAGNWGACVVLFGAGLTCLALVQPWGRVVPTGVRLGIAWIGGVIALAHWALFTGASALRLAGVVGYQQDVPQTLEQLRHFDWINVLAMELWFGLMGLLLIACARHALRDRPASGSGARAGGALVVGGVVTVVLGVMFFNAWTFALIGPAVVASGALVLALSRGDACAA